MGMVFVTAGKSSGDVADVAVSCVGITDFNALVDVAEATVNGLDMVDIDVASIAALGVVEALTDA